MREADGIISEAQKIELINKYFTTENVRASEYMKKYDATSWIDGIHPYQFEKNEVNLRNILSETVIPSPIYEKYRQEIESRECSGYDKKLYGKTEREGKSHAVYTECSVLVLVAVSVGGPAGKGAFICAR